VCAKINGEQVEFLSEPRQSLLECLRDILELTGSKEGCNDGNCGACSVLLNGRLVNSCLVLGVEVDGQEVTTVEGLADWRGLHPIQQAFLDHAAFQCGYCTPGILIASKALLDIEPNPSEDRIRTWLSGNLCRCTGYDKIVRAVQDAAARLRQVQTGKSISKKGLAAGAADHSVVGTRAPRADGPDKLTGRALFGPDTSLPGTLYGKMVRSPHAHARIRSIDTSRAFSYPGVYAVVTAQDLPGLKENKSNQDGSLDDFKSLRENMLASEKVLYVGHPVAAVAAISPHIAEEAVKLIEVEYDILPPVMSVRSAIQSDSPLLHEQMITQSLSKPSQKPSNIASHFQHVKGDPSQGFAQADLVVEREFSMPTVHQGYIEPHACTAWWGLDNHLTVWTTTQGAFGMRDQLTKLLAHPMSNIRVVPTEVGGAFGGKLPIYIFLEAVAALLSRKTNRPVKMTMTRGEVFMATNPTSGAYIKAKMGVTREGRITAAKAELYFEAGAYPSAHVIGYLGFASGFMLAPYDIPHGQIDAYDVVVNKPRTAALRAPGVTQVNFAAEQVVDEIAVKLGMDPIAFRLRNVVHEGTELINGTSHGSIGAEEVLRAAQSTSHYSTPLNRPYSGRGVAQGYWGNWGARSSCTISVNSDGTVNLVTGSVDLSGTRTTVAMQAAEVLGLSPDRIQSSVGDTDSVGYTEISGGSRTTFATGIAAITAAQDVVTQMRERAAFLWGVEVQEVTFNRGIFTTSHGGERQMTFTEVAGKLAETGGAVMGKGNVDPQGWGGAFGTHIVDVQIDPETGKVDILRYTAVQDVGKAVHPSYVEGQMQGGAVQGVGWGLYEGYQYNTQGDLLNPNFLDYKIPTALDVPMIDTVIVEVPGPNHPYGVRGVGEIPIVPPPAALANAIYRAAGKRVTDLPLTPARILEAMGVI
jgi:CO/xanthine dehydrogenase Mo-binding subunit/aerobic-type carbon monoxide dehydrogenase small subunit (CoxS/CutS family)